MIDELCALLVSVAASDAEVNQQEVRAIKAYFEGEARFGESALEAVRVSLKRAIAGHPSEREPLRISQLSAPERLGFLDALFEVALADGSLTRAERDAIKRAAGQAGVLEGDYRRVAELHFGGGSAHFAVLGLDASASDDDVKRAFRQLATVEHPDRAAQLSAPEQALAADRFRAIKDAYDRIRELRWF